MERPCKRCVEIGIIFFGHFLHILLIYNRFWSFVFVHAHLDFENEGLPCDFPSGMLPFSPLFVGE